MKKKNFLLCLWVTVILGCAVSIAWLVSPCGDARAASAPDIKIACVYPLSGAFSRNGNLSLQGAKAMMNWVNDNGGIKSLGGAKLVPIVADCGSTVEGSANAMERVCRDPEIIMANGCWASSFTMAATEVTERLGIPMISFGFADALTKRGFKYGFYPSPPQSELVKLALPRVIEMAKSAGKEIKTAMAVGNNQVASKYLFDASKEVFSSRGIKWLGEETWPVGSLTDATPFMQKVKTLKPDIVIYNGDALSEVQMFMMKKKELDDKTPFYTGGAWIGDPSLRSAAEYLEGWIAQTPSWPHKLTPQEWVSRCLDQVRKEYSDEPWVGQDLSFGMMEVPLIAEILERGGTRDRKIIRDVASKLDIKNVPATRHLVAQGMAFDETGRVAEKYRGVLIVQWQGGRPVSVYPPNLAVAQPRWRSH